MKLYLDKNIAKGTPEELARYKEITSNSNNHLERRLEEVTNGIKPESLNIEEVDDEVDDEVSNPDYKKGCFYTITEEARESLLPVGVVLKHQYDRMFDDSQGVRYIITNQDYLKRDNIFDFQDDIIRGRFDFATQLGIRLNTTTDFSVEASDKTFKIKEDDVVFAKGELVKLIKDDNDRLPLFKSIKDNRNDFVLINKVEPTQDTDTEEEFYDFYEVVDNYIFNSKVKEGTILKRVGDVSNLSNNERGNNLVTSTGLQQVSHMEDNAIKPILGSHIKKRFEFAEQTGVMLTVDTDFGEECKGSLFKVTKDKKESGSCFEKGAIVKLGHDDGSLMPSFYDKENNQYVYLGAVKEIARPRKDK